MDTTNILQTHSLKALRRFIKENILDFKADWKIILQADGYYFSSRYPGDSAFLVGQEDVDDCWEAVEEARDASLYYIKTREEGIQKPSKNETE